MNPKTGAWVQRVPTSSNETDATSDPFPRIVLSYLTHDGDEPGGCICYACVSQEFGPEAEHYQPSPDEAQKAASGANGQTSPSPSLERGSALNTTATRSSQPKPPTEQIEWWTNAPFITEQEQADLIDYINEGDSWLSALTALQIGLAEVMDQLDNQNT